MVTKFIYIYIYMGVSENNVPHCTQWLMIIIPIKWLFHWEYTLFSDKPIWLFNIAMENCPFIDGLPMVY